MLTVTAPAKINLYLHITGKRDNGYHELDSLTVFSAYGDQISIEQADSLSLSMNGPFAKDLAHEKSDDNLIIQAAKKLCAICDIVPNYHMTLTKNLPVSAGIGGGSSDAAAAIKAILHIEGLATKNMDGLDELLLNLGADVPVCFKAAPVRMQGIGEILRPQTLVQNIPAVLVNPGQSCSTPEIFSQFDGIFSAEVPDYNIDDDLIFYLGSKHNDLTKAAQSLIPDIGTVLNTLEQAQGCKIARMSGSGATCFGLFGSMESAQHTAQKIQESHPDWWVMATIFNPSDKF